MNRMKTILESWFEGLDHHAKIDVERTSTPEEAEFLKGPDASF